MKWLVVGIVIIVLLAALLYYYRAAPEVEKIAKPAKSLTQYEQTNMQLTSPAFSEGQTIPAKFTCSGADVNPPLEISGVPENTQSLVLVMDDPDATGGVTWDHWVVWNVDPKTFVIVENSVPAGAIQGMTSFGDKKYGGPCPPRGSKPHRYMFKLYALDAVLDLPPASHKSDVEGAMQEHVVAKTTFMGLFKR